MLHYGRPSHVYLVRTLLLGLWTSPQAYSPHYGIHGFLKKKRESDIFPITHRLLRTVRPSLIISARLLATGSKLVDRLALLPDRRSPMERETIAAQPPLPPPPQGPNAWSAARKTSASACPAHCGRVWSSPMCSSRQPTAARTELHTSRARLPSLLWPGRRLPVRSSRRPG